MTKPHEIDSSKVNPDKFKPIERLLSKWLKHTSKPKETK